MTQPSRLITAFTFLDIWVYAITNAIGSSWGDIHLPPPSLNITPYWDDNPWGSPSSTAPFTYEGKVYDLEYFTNDRAICQPFVDSSQPQQKYQWGFSIIQLEITLCLLTLWTFGIFVLWTTAHLRFASMGTAYNASGKFKSAISLVDALRKELGQKTERDIDSLTEPEILSCIKLHLNGGRVMQVHSLPLILEQSGWKLIQKWVKTNKGQTLAVPILSLSTLVIIVSLIDMTAGMG